MFAGTDADSFLDRLDPDRAISNGAAILETTQQRARNEREYASKGAVSAPVPASAETARERGRGD